MIKKVFKIYLYPIIALIFSFFPWYFFTKFVLKINWTQLLYQALECKNDSCLESFKYFCIFMLMLIYLIWVILNIRLEKAKDEKSKDEVLYKFFNSYGHAIAIIVSIQFLIRILFIMF